MNAYNVKRILKSGEMNILTLAIDADTAIKELGWKRYGRKNVKAQQATVEDIVSYIEILNDVEIYEESKKGEQRVNQGLIDQCNEIIQQYQTLVS